MSKNRFKFRAWQNGMVTQKESGVYATKKFLDTLYEDCILMQSTGLTDSKDKEIFEGDVIREEFNHGICNCEIIYEKAGFFISNEKEEIKDNLHWHMNGLEVIGNIYENPELITPDPLSE